MEVADFTSNFDASGSVVVRVRGMLHGGQPLAIVYTLDPSGRLGVAMTLPPVVDSMPNEIPRMGVRGEFAGTLGEVHWFGPGPDETYWDRLQLPLGRWSSSIADQFFGYSEPQETGGHAAARWMALTDDSGAGVMVMPDTERCSVAGQPLTFSALTYSIEQLEVARYPDELDADGRTHVTLDLAQTGVGGDNSWGAKTMPRYTLSGNAVHTFAFSIWPIGGMDDIERIRGRKVGGQ